MVICFLVVAGLLVTHGPLDVQIIAIAIARLVTGAFIVTPPFLYILMRLTKISFREVVGGTARCMTASACAVAAILAVHTPGILSSCWPIVVLAVEIFFGVIVGAPILLIPDSQMRRAFQQRFNLPRAPTEI